MEDLFPYDFWQVVASKMREGQRKGQAVFNTAHYFYTDEARVLDGSIHDPFHNDSKVGEFLTRLADLLTR